MGETHTLTGSDQALRQLTVRLLCRAMEQAVLMQERLNQECLAVIREHREPSPSREAVVRLHPASPEAEVHPSDSLAERLAARLCEIRQSSLSGSSAVDFRPRQGADVFDDIISLALGLDLLGAATLQQARGVLELSMLSLSRLDDLSPVDALLIEEMLVGDKLLDLLRKIKIEE